MVSMPCADWQMLASSRLRSFVDPPAPHVILIASGWSWDRRWMRVRRFAKPCDSGC